ncbi:DUF488 domain-containing protein [Candidatus Parcubacteria bacterium]|nr:MAG: DUF488 domain-containing protein [Candidatus Parcubacteria bacterium]
MLDIRLKRVYDPPEPEDGFRVLVDRVWPRGMSKARVHAHLWLKEVAPSTALRKWFSHDRVRWEAFKSRYFEELEANPQAVERLLHQAAKGTVTLLYSAKDPACNQAVALREFLLARGGRAGS